MNIDEYLRQLRKYKLRAEYKLNKYNEAFDKAASPGCALDYGDMAPRTRGNGNATENRLIKAIDAGKEWKAAWKQYTDFREQLITDLYGLLYWEGLLLDRVYIYNLMTESEDDLHGADEILRTNNRGEILSKLTEAKKHLADVLRARGVEIEN